MPTPLPTNHIDDGLSLQADAKVSLFELYPLVGSSVFFKADDSITWKSNLYEGLPCSLSGEEFDTNKTPTPRLQIGQEDLDLLPFKGLIHDGYLEGATLIRHRLLLEDLLNDLNIKETTYFRVKRVQDYSRTNITLVLASYSTATNQTIPFRQYLPPDFPYVDL